jgi:hypothetical protein
MLSILSPFNPIDPTIEEREGENIVLSFKLNNGESSNFAEYSAYGMWDGTEYKWVFNNCLPN